jgi:hypothetical protein
MSVGDYGPKRPDGIEAPYNTFENPYYMRGYTKKIKENLLRWFRLYNGKPVTIFRVDKSGDRCPECTDQITGAKTVSNCTVCGGTGYVTKYKKLGTYWGLMNFAARIDDATPLGNQERVSGGKDTVIVVDPPLLHDTDILVFEKLNAIYKIVDLEPQICGLAGDVICQTIQIAHLPPGSREYEEGVLPE